MPTQSIQSSVFRNPADRSICAGKIQKVAMVRMSAPNFIPSKLMLALLTSAVLTSPTAHASDFAKIMDFPLSVAKLPVGGVKARGEGGYYRHIPFKGPRRPSPAPRAARHPYGSPEITLGLKATEAPLTFGSGIQVAAPDLQDVTLSFDPPSGRTTTQVRLAPPPKTHADPDAGQGRGRHMTPADMLNGFASPEKHDPSPAVSRALADAEALVARQPEILQVPELITSDITKSDFPHLRDAAIEAISRPGSGVEERLELARVLIGGGFAHEAMDVLRDAHIEFPGMAPDEAVALSSMALAAGVLGSEPGNLPDRSRQSQWADARFWPIMERLQMKQGDVAAEDIRQAASALSQQSEAVSARVFPALFEAALAMGDADLSGDLLGAAKSISDFEGSSMHHWMQGRLAMLKHDEETAFDRFVSSSGVNDLYGARSRVAIADMVLARRDPALLPELRKILEEGVVDWRGDNLALGMMVRLASVTETMADAPAALSIMVRIMDEYPDTREADLARERVPLIMRAYQASLESGRTDLRSYLAAMRDLGPGLEGFVEWRSSRAALAKTLGDRGLHRAAAAEYHALGQTATRAEDFAVLEALEHLAAGDDAEVEKILSSVTQSHSAELEAARRELSVKFGLSKFSDEDLAGATEGELREYAKKSWDNLSYDYTAAAYDLLISRGKSLSGAEVATYLHAKAIVAKNLADDTIARDALRGETETITLAAKTLSLDMPDLSRLSTHTADQMLDDAGLAIEAAQGVLDQNAKAPAQSEGIGHDEKRN